MKKVLIYSASILLTSVILILPNIILAQGFDGPGIGREGGFVPCGTDLTDNECNFCYLIKMIQRVFRFLIYLAAPLVTLLIAWAGIKLIVNAENTSERENAKTLLKDALVGFILMLMAGFIVNLILGLLVSADKRPAGWWWGGNLKCENVIPNTDVNLLYIEGTNQNQVTVTGGATIDLTAPMGQESIVAGFRNASSYDRDIQDMSEKYGIPPDRIKAIIIAESSGKAGEISPAGAVGLMQLLPSTAKEIDQKLFGGANFGGLSDTEIKNKLISNTRLNIELGTAYYSEGLKKSNEDHTSDSYNRASTYARASAYYNGGNNAIAPSRDCPGIQAWQCPYDSPGCFVDGKDIGGSCAKNKGYAETRTYTQNINNAQAYINRK